VSHFGGYENDKKIRDTKIAVRQAEAQACATDFNNAGPVIFLSLNLISVD
jgi:hypothetical protein